MPTGGSPSGGSCDGIPAYAPGAAQSYAEGDSVVAVCDGGTTCSDANPPGVDGVLYEFSCLDTHNCASQDPGTTNWSDSPWALVGSCE